MSTLFLSCQSKSRPRGPEEASAPDSGGGRTGSGVARVVVAQRIALSKRVKAVCLAGLVTACTQPDDGDFVPIDIPEVTVETGTPGGMTPSPTLPVGPTPTATPLATPTGTPGATPTGTPTATPTSTPGATPTPPVTTPTPTPSPTPPLETPTAQPETPTLVPTPTATPPVTPVPTPTDTPPPPTPTFAPTPTPAQTPVPDADQDGAPDVVDCNDTDPTVFPGASEICDLKDNDCDQGVDEGFDLDSDGYTSCASPVADCNDAQPSIFPGAFERCDGIDSNCDQNVDTEWNTVEGIGITVDVNAKLEGGDGTVERPFQSIQDGIDATAPGCEIVSVLPGTYVEMVDFDGRDISVISERGAAKTIIDARQGGSVVSFHRFEGPDAVLEGFTLTSGRANTGGGVFCFEASPTLRDNIIQGNTALQFGGGAYLDVCDAVFEGNLIDTNSARSTTDSVGSGGGLFVVGGAPTLMDNDIQSNSAMLSGGGIALIGGSRAKLEGGSITLNTALEHGGGVYSLSAYPQIVDMLIEANNASDNGGGILLEGCEDSSYPCVMRELSVVSNRAIGGSGGGISVKDSKSVVLERSLISNNRAGSGGGGLSALNAHPRVVNNIFHCNDGGRFGGGIYLEASFAQLLHNTVLENTVLESGGGIYFKDLTANANKGVTIVNNIIVKHLKNGIQHEGPTTAWSIRANDVFGNGVGGLANYGGMSDLTGYDGNISADPIFATHKINCNPADDTLMPLSASPVVDSGQDVEVRQDFRSNPRPTDGNNDGILMYDMGAYER